MGTMGYCGAAQGISRLSRIGIDMGNHRISVQAAQCAVAAITWTACTGPASAGLSIGSGGSAATSLRISELRVDQQGADTDEYFELYGAPGMSLTGCWFVAIGDSGTDPGGIVEMAIDLSTWTLGSNGRFVGHEATFGATAFNGQMLVVDPAGNHASIGTGDSLNFENSDSVTYLLVRSFAGTVGMDLDPGNDGTLDALPWKELLDSVAFVRSNSTDPIYSTVTIGPVKLTSTGGMPPHAWLDDAGWHAGEYASWVYDTPGGGPTVPAPGAAITLAAAACAALSRRRKR